MGQHGRYVAGALCDQLLRRRGYGAGADPDGRGVAARLAGLRRARATLARARRGNLGADRHVRLCHRRSASAGLDVPETGLHHRRHVYPA